MDYNICSISHIKIETVLDSRCKLDWLIESPWFRTQQSWVLSLWLVMLALRRLRKIARSSRTAWAKIKTESGEGEREGGRRGDRDTQNYKKGVQ